MTITKPDTEIPRDSYQRPLVKPPNGGRPVAYTRCTTYVGVLEDMFKLQQWEKRMVALGLNQRPDLQLAVSAHSDDKNRLDKICKEAKEAAAASAAATTGTALHALTERLDRGQDVGVVPDTYLADLAAYQQATEPLQATHIEQFTVLDTLQIGGTPDRVVKLGDKRYIADVKTGSVEFGTLKIAMQLAIYARSLTYDHNTGERGDHGAENSWGLVIHLPAGQGTCTLFWIDLLEGWEAVKTARRVREWRTKKFKDLTRPFTPEPAAEPAEQQPFSLDTAIDECLTEVALRELWAEHHTEFTPAHIQRAKQKKHQLQNGVSA